MSTVTPTTGSRLSTNIVSGAAQDILNYQPEDPATTGTRLSLAAPGAAIIGGGAWTLDLWRRQGWKVGFSGDPAHVALRAGIPALLGGALLGGAAVYALSSKLGEHESQSIRNGSLIGAGIVAGGVLAGIRIKDPGGIWSSVRNAQGQLVPKYGFTEKFREVAGYGVNYGIVGGLAGGATGFGVNALTKGTGT